MSRHRFGWRRLGVLVIVAGALIIAGASPSSADFADETSYTVDMRGTTGAAPDTYAGDNDSTIAIKITNTSSSQKLGSANVTVPAPFKLVSAPGDAETGGPVIELRNLNLVVGGSVTVTITVDVRTCVPTTPAAFDIVAKKNNDYSGSIFTLKAPSDRQVNVIGKCKLAFVAQPTDAERNVSITSEFNPGGAPITVEVRDAGNTGRATSSTALIALSAANASVPQPIEVGNPSATAVAGLASFTPGPKLSVSAFDYTFTAGSDGLISSSPSSKFAIADDQVACLAGQPCNAAATTTKSGVTATATFGSGATSTNLAVTIGAADAPVFECTGYPKRGSQVSQFVFTGDGGGDRTGTFSVTIPNASWLVILYQVCWASPVDFLTKFGKWASAHADVGDGTPKPGTTTGEKLKVGLLPNCKKWWWNDHWDWDPHWDFPNPTIETLPCISSRKYNHANRSVTIEVKATGADPWRY